MARLSYKQLNKEADQCGYGTFENRLLQYAFENKQGDVDDLLDTASHHAVKMVLIDLIDTLGECHEWYTPKECRKVVALATKIVEQRLLNIKDEDTGTI